MGSSGRAQYCEHNGSSSLAISDKLVELGSFCVNSITSFCIFLENSNSRFWIYVKARRQDSMGVVTINDWRVLHSESKTKAGVLIKQFCLVFIKEDSSSTKVLDGLLVMSIGPPNITLKESPSLLQSLNINKASRTNSICNHIFNYLDDEIGPFLTAIVRKS